MLWVDAINSILGDPGDMGPVGLAGIPGIDGRDVSTSIISSVTQIIKNYRYSCRSNLVATKKVLLYIFS